MGKVTIIDVAKLAGVSKGTVDRVIHNRGEVSKKSEEKVRKAIEELDFKPNIYASVLASRTVKTIIALLPSSGPGEYWEQIYNGYMSGASAVSQLGVVMRPVLFDQTSLESFCDACSEALDASPDAVAFSPMFKDESIRFASELSSRAIPYVYVDSRLEDSGYFSYIGMPMYQSGFLAGALLTERVAPEKVDRVALVRIKRDKTGQSDPTLGRREGFLNYMESNFPDCAIDSIFIDPYDDDSAYDTLTEFFKEKDDVKYVVMLNSRIHLLSRFLRENPVPGRRVVGFDALPLNVDILKEGLVDVLVSQHIADQSHKAVVSLADYIIGRKEPLSRDILAHMDILTKLNIENY